MHKAKVFYDYYDGQESPMWYVIQEGIDWCKPTQYFHISAPFEKASRFDFEDHLMNVSVYMQEMTQKYNRPYELGLNLLAISARVKEAGMYPEDIDQLILLVGDIEEVLNLKIF